MAARLAWGGVGCNVIDGMLASEHKHVGRTSRVLMVVPSYGRFLSTCSVKVDSRSNDRHTKWSLENDTLACRVLVVSLRHDRCPRVSATAHVTKLLCLTPSGCTSMRDCGRSCTAF